MFLVALRDSVARLRHALIGTAVLLLCAGVPGEGQAAGKPCCNTQNGQFVAIEDVDECNAKPGHVHIGKNAQNAAQVMVCYQNVQQQAHQMMGNQYPGSQFLNKDGTPDMSAISAMMSGNVETPDPEFQCCDSAAREFVGVMTETACQEKGAAFLPDSPDNLAATQVCRGSGGGGGGAWSKEDYEPNITNGGMEDWRDENRPHHFTTWGLAPEIARSYPIDIQVAFRSSDAHTGASSLRLKPADILPQLPPQARGPIAAMSGKPHLLSPAAALTCDEPCPVEKGGGAQVANSASAALKIFGSLPAEDIQSHVCGAYKGYIGYQDQLRLTVVVVRPGASNFSAQMVADITESTSDWVEFAFPLTTLSDVIPDSGNVGIGAQVLPRGGVAGLGNTGPSGWDISPFSDVTIDSIHFCSPVKLIAYHPEAMKGIGGKKVSEREEDLAGVQTFVNLDNDDEDEMFDHEDDNGVEGDDELVRLRMEMPKNSFGKAEFRAKGVGDLIQLWDDPNKTGKFEDYNKEMELLELLRTSADGEKYEREIWVEALKPSKKQGDSEFEFVFRNAMNKDEITRDKVVMTALAIEKIEFKGQGNAKDGGNDLDDDPNWPRELQDKAVRVFPGKPWEGTKPADEPKNKVTVEVTLNVVPTRPVKFYFRSFDVDDPTADDDEVDDESEADDNRGDFPRKEGLIISPTGEILEKEFEGIRAEFEFQVTRQPGDNFRIAGYGDRDHLLALENDDQKVAEFSGRPATWIFEKNILDKTEDPAKARVAEHDHYVSPVLTVWRRFYLEVDDMAPVQGTKIESTVVDLRRAGTESRPYTNPDGTTGTQTLNIQWIKIKTNLASHLPDSSKEYGIDGLENSWAGGRLIIGGSTFGVLGNTAKPGGYDEIKVGHLKDWLGDNVKELPVELYDDDAFKDGDSLPKIDLTRLTEAFAPGYILPMVDDLLPNATSVRPFMLHAYSDQYEDLKRMMRRYFDNKALDDDPDFWLVYLQNGYQGALPEDADPEAAALSGQADNNPLTGRGGWGAIVYQESARESQRNYGGVPGWRLQDIAPHEIGHLFGGQHSHEGLMSESATKSPMFDDKTLDAMRSRQNP